MKLEQLAQQEFWVSAKWDSEYEVYYSESNIPGLNIEASSLGEFENVMFDIAPEMIFENILKPALETQGFECEVVDGEMVAKSRPPFAKKIAKLPENVPFLWKGAEPRHMNLAMA